jgi:hypothetical protein
MSEGLQENEAGLPEALLHFNKKALNQLKRSIMISLGHGRVKVELSEDQIDLAIEESIETLTAYFAHQNGSYFILNATPGVSEYDIPSGTKIVQDVIYDPSNSVLNTPNIFNNQLYAIGQGVDTATFTMMLMNIKLAQKSYSKISSWELLNNGKIKIYPNPESSYTMVLKLIGSFSSVSQDQYTWIKKYATGEAMTILGRIRSKFSSVPSSQGQVSWDGEAMKQEGESLKAQIMEEVRMRNPVYAFTTG